MASIKVGSKMLYCKIVGDKSSEEEVEVVNIQSEAEGGGVTIYIPSLKRDRDTILSRLTPIDIFVEKPQAKSVTEDIAKIREELQRINRINRILVINKERMEKDHQEMKRMNLLLLETQEKMEKEIEVLKKIIERMK